MLARESKPLSSGRTARLRRAFAHLHPRPVSATALSACVVLTAFAVLAMRAIEAADDLGAVPFSLVVLLALVATALSGLVAGVAATILASVGVIYFVVPPYESFSISDESQWFRVAIECSIAVIVALLYHALAQQAQRSREFAARLEQANQAKDDFIGNVSHDLRTPLTVMLGNAAIINREQERLEPAERTEAVQEIIRSGERLQRMIENLLALARPESVRVPDEPVIVRHVVRALIDACLRQHPGRQINLSVPPEPRPVVCAWEAMEEVVANLISNADKYSPTDSPVDVSISHEPTALVISVADRGLGFGNGDVAALFEPFARSEAARAAAPGLGIGLTIAQRLVEAHGGCISARNRVGGGAEVIVSLPARVVEPDPAETVAEGQDL